MIKEIITKMSNSTELTTINIDYNSGTKNLENPNDTLSLTIDGSTYQTKNSDKKPIIKLTYENICILSNNIHHIYVILQHIKKKNTILELYKFCEWDYSKWKVEITPGRGKVKNLPDWANILICLLNLGNKLNKPINIKILEEVKLNDKRGWGGERPREVYYKLGFPLYTPKTKKSLKNSERLFECPFPICRINPKRKAIVSNTSTEKKCFTCGCKEGDTNIFGNPCNFEKGHFDPHINGGDETAGNQCKQCNSFYKDKISWDYKTGKPTFNSYAILRDAPKKEIIKELIRLGFTPEDLR